MKIIYGGSFNPPTIAHKEAYYFLDKLLNFDEFVYMPVSNKYSKSGLIDNEYRYDMLKLMIKDMNKARVSRTEIDSDSYNGTYHLLKDEPLDTYFLLGSDNLRELYKWINAKKLVEERKFIVLSRNDSKDSEFIENDSFLKDYKNNFLVFDSFDVKVSSTTFRESKDFSIIPSEVKDYINEKGLYGIK